MKFTIAIAALLSLVVPATIDAKGVRSAAATAEQKTAAKEQTKAKLQRALRILAAKSASSKQRKLGFEGFEQDDIEDPEGGVEFDVADLLSTLIYPNESDTAEDEIIGGDVLDGVLADEGDIFGSLGFELVGDVDFEDGTSDVLSAEGDVIDDETNQSDEGINDWTADWETTDNDPGSDYNEWDDLPIVGPEEDQLDDIPVPFIELLGELAEGGGKRG